MRMGLKQIIVCSGLIVLLLYASASAAQEELVQKENGPEKIAAKIVSELNLSPEQSEEIKNQRSEHRRIGNQLKRSLREKQKELKSELEKEVSDRGKIARIAGDIKQLQGESVDHRIEGILHMKEVLTPEQYRKFYQKTRPHGRQRGRRMKKRF